MGSQLSRISGIRSNDPNTQCPWQDPNGGEQCPNQVHEGYRYCEQHSRQQIASDKRKIVNRYKVAAFQAQLDQDTSRSDVKNLRNEIAVCHTLTQKILDICKCEASLLQYSQHLVTLINSTASLAMAFTRIETDTQALLDKGVLFDLVEIIILAITPYVEQEYKDDPDYAKKVIINFTDHLMQRIAVAMGSDTRITVQSDLGNPILRLKHWDAALKSYYQDPKICDLRSEIALCRLILQTIINQCPTPAAILHEYARVVGCVETLRRLCLTANFIDKSIGNLLDRSTVIVLADAFSRDLAVVVSEENMPSLVETLNHEFARIIPDQVDNVSSSTFCKEVQPLRGELPGDGAAVSGEMDL